MHTEKNIVNNILGRLLDMNGKTKDNLEACQDLRKMNLRPEDIKMQVDRRLSQANKVFSQ
jgi:hypothetical protein